MKIVLSAHAFNATYFLMGTTPATPASPAQHDLITLALWNAVLKEARGMPRRAARPRPTCRGIDGPIVQVGPRP